MSRSPPLVIVEAERGLRVDALVARRGLAASVAAARRLVEQGLVRLDGRRPRKGERVQVGQVLEVAEAPSPPVLVPEPDLPLAVLYVDDDLVAVNKLAGVPSHPLRPGEHGSTAAALCARFPECAAASLDPRGGGLGHRLDVGTSGVLIAARRRAVWDRLRVLLSGGESRKTYLAEVVGGPGSDEVVVDLPIGRPGRRSPRVRVGQGRGLLPARTEVRVRQRRGQTTLVEAQLAAGRPHQVRAHLGHLGCPVLGDEVYGDERARALAAERALTGFRLHAWRVFLPHPVTGAPLTVEAPLPDWAR